MKGKSAGAERIPFGGIRPSGWMKEQMVHDMEHGFLGKLDQLVPQCFAQDDIYGKNRLGGPYRQKNLGVTDPDVEGTLQLQWWNSETQSNWYDGFVRTALLLEHRAGMEKAAQYVTCMLSYQDCDGYMGIYQKQQRFCFDFEAGELWAQSTLFRVLLAYYEATNDDQVLHAVVKAMDVIMEAYPPYASTPFLMEQSHGLTITDALETLYIITNNEKYIAYALWLYEDFSRHNIPEYDAQLGHLLRKEQRFACHGVHTYEHLRAVVIASHYGGDRVAHEALNAYLAKLEQCLSPSGGPIGDEWIAHNVADATMTGYEYCSIQELLHAYTSLLEKTGCMEWADRIEWLYYNAGQGARHPDEPSIAYLKSDNSYAMQGNFQYEQPHCTHSVQTRYKYSPTHQDVAVCCVPNAGRLTPYFVQSMWMKSAKGLIKTVYGPNTLHTQINGVLVDVEEITKYPFEKSCTFYVTVQVPCSFEIVLRKPSWCHTMRCVGEGITVAEDRDAIVVHKNWEGRCRFDVQFDAAVVLHTDARNDAYVSYGPLVFVLPLACEEIKETTYDIPGFRDVYYTTKENIPFDLAIDANKINTFHVEERTQVTHLWKDALRMHAHMVRQGTNQEESVVLVPMGGTILRKVTFPVAGEAVGTLCAQS
jgi:DUF1680 family protein